MKKRTFASRTFAARTFASRTWALHGRHKEFLKGNLTARPHLVGKVTVEASLRGTVVVNP